MICLFKLATNNVQYHSNAASLRALLSKNPSHNVRISGTRHIYQNYIKKKRRVVDLNFQNQKVTRRGYNMFIQEVRVTGLLSTFFNNLMVCEEWKTS